MTDFNDTLRLMREQAQAYGFAVFQNEDVAPGQVVLVDMNALELDLKVERLTVLEREDRWDQKTGYEMRYSLGIDFGRTVVEKDPFWQKPPQDFRGAVRWIGRVIGYDWRRLRGKLRRYPKSIGLITGLSA